MVHQMIIKPSSKPIWLVGTQVAAEHPQSKNLDQRKNISIILSPTISHLISLNFNGVKIVVNTATKKNLTEKLSRNALNVVYFVPCKRTKLFSKTSFLADCKRYLFINIFFSNGIVKVLIKQNKHAKLCN